MQPLEREIRLSGLRFHYVEWGTAAAPPLVLRHGFTGHARTWDDFAASWAACFRVLPLDQRGHGDSDRAPHGDCRIATMAQDVAAFADALCPRPFRLVGLSMGGRVAIAYGGSRPGRGERLGPWGTRAPVAPAGGVARVQTTVANVPDDVASEEQAYRLLRAASPRYSDSLIRHRVKHGFNRLPGGRVPGKHDKGLRAPA